MMEDDRTKNARLQELTIGHVITTKPLPPKLNSDIDLAKYDGSDIVKNPERARRKKAVFILPACLSVSGVGGKLGTIANMNTGFPVLYIDFPNGRMKLQGRLVEPKKSLMPIKFKKGGKVVVKNAVKTMIVFSKTSWIGTKEENPEEKSMPMPEGV